MVALKALRRMLRASLGAPGGSENGRANSLGEFQVLKAVALSLSLIASRNNGRSLTSGSSHRSATMNGIILSSPLASSIDLAVARIESQVQQAPSTSRERMARRIFEVPVYPWITSKRASAQRLSISGNCVVLPARVAPMRRRFFDPTISSKDLRPGDALLAPATR